MSIKRLLFPSLAICGVLALTLRLFGKTAQAKPVSDGMALIQWRVS